MTSAQFDFAPLLPAGLPAPAAKWTGLAKYNFIGGNNDPDQVPVDGLAAAVNAVLQREGKTLATYGLASGPQGYRPLREFLTGKLKRDAGIDCTADDILVTSGSLQALDLVNGVAARARRHRHHRAGMLPGLDQPADAGSASTWSASRSTATACAWTRWRTRSTTSSAKGVTPKYIYTIPTVQNPTGTIMPEARRAELLRLSQAVRRADLRGRLLCRPDLGRQASARDLRHEQERRRRSTSARSRNRSRRRCGSATSSRGWDVLSRTLALKTDAGSGALEQMVLAEYCAPHFATHVPELTRGLRAKLETLMEALNEQFGTVGRVRGPEGRHLPVGEAAGQRRHA